MTETTLVRTLPDGYTIKSGAHQKPHAGPDEAGDMCIMEAVAFIAGEKHSDSPACTCPTIASAARKINDSMPDDATRTALLLPLAPKLVGTRGPVSVMIKRAFIAADYAVRVFAPMALEARGLTDQAAILRGLAQIVDEATARKGQAASANAAAASASAAYSAAASASAAAAAAYSAAASASAAAAYSASAANAANASAASAAAAANAAADAAANAAYARPAWEKAAEMLSAMCAVLS